LASKYPIELIQTVNGIEVRQRDVATLLPDNMWLNDTVIDDFLSLIVAKQKLRGLSYLGELPIATDLFFRQFPVSRATRVIPAVEYYQYSSEVHTKAASSHAITL